AALAVHALGAENGAGEAWSGTSVGTVRCWEWRLGRDLDRADDEVVGEGRIWVGRRNEVEDGRRSGCRELGGEGRGPRCPRRQGGEVPDGDAAAHGAAVCHRDRAERRGQDD